MTTRTTATPVVRGADYTAERLPSGVWHWYSCGHNGYALVATVDADACGLLGGIELPPQTVMYAWPTCGVSPAVSEYGPPSATLARAIRLAVLRAQAGHDVSTGHDPYAGTDAHDCDDWRDGECSRCTP